MREETIKTTYHYKGRLLKLRDDEIKLENGRIARREIVEHPGAVCVIGITADKKLVLIRQFRKPVEEEIVEICAGLVDPGETLEQAAKRELHEETGYIAGKLEKILSAYATPGYSTEMIHYFIAADLRMDKQRNEEDEQIEVLLLPIGEALQKIKSGVIKDNKTIIGIMLANEKVHT